MSFIDIVFDGPPGPNTDGHHCNFVEVENPDGSGAGVGEWIDRGNGRWALRIPAPADIPEYQRQLIPVVLDAAWHGYCEERDGRSVTVTTGDQTEGGILTNSGDGWLELADPETGVPRHVELVSTSTVEFHC